jgi:hypothetical protein
MTLPFAKPRRFNPFPFFAPMLYAEGRFSLAEEM